MFWISEPSIIVGKHQNVFAEINHGFIHNNNIPVVRRISGGGTVYHDNGNVNYTMILNGQPGKLVDYPKYTKPIIQSLKKLGIDAYLDKKSSLFINGLKISGNAEHVYKNRIMHHGTLLFSTNLENLNMAIKSKEKTYSGKAVKSIRSQVTNISKHLPEHMNIQDFKDYLSGFMKNYFQSDAEYILNNNDIREINKLVKEKYRLWEWNYGYSPFFRKRFKYNMEGMDQDLELGVTNGMITEVHFKKSGIARASELATVLKNKRYHPDEIRISMNSVKFANQIDPENFIQEMF